MLRLDHICTGYGRLMVLDGITIVVEQGSVVGLLGANGAGKTTLVKTIMGLLPTWSGGIRFCDDAISNLSSHAIVKRGITLVPQGRELFPDMTVAENLEIAGLTQGGKKLVRELCEEQFHYFPRLKERANQRASTLSGGEQQMLAIARALMLRPKLLLLDEPTMGLAPLVIDDLALVIKKLSAERGLTIFVIEQNLRLVMATTDKVYIINNGKNVFEGKSSALSEDKDIVRFYLE